ncbi:uncharacterized protein BDZ99DRAFT_419247 [Mytilinidion resinicola]|uniref:Tubulin-specific chaperone D C-terminal domain-containing protein n=1 Tax=Mytilinidion resinicola TaxID=574789 RepID=A0A6A6YHH9_9PEZI|nr:uncharacterized protein BDZ99DRAFT_419247 [Mytilinidion resinicola]KAF2808276.1 hypothetical protein BDZ99DRAFT_419247 [Mytilinidion resinicola]
MNATDDDDVVLQKAASTLLLDLQALINRVLRKENGAVHRRVRERDLDRFIPLLVPFQEDPQLLDAQLKHLIPPLVAAYLDYLRITPRPGLKKKFVPLSHAICRILNLFCNVRGEKVVIGFLNNEPRYLEPVLAEFESGLTVSGEELDAISQKIIPWEERYVLLLWLSHLMLAPFPLASISATHSSEETSKETGIKLPSELSGVVLRVLPICVAHLKSASKERGAAGSLLVKLVLRPDMQKIGMLDALIQWALTSLESFSEGTSDIHQYLGVLSFISGIVASATNQEIGPYLQAIYTKCQLFITSDALAFVRSSAVARKLVIKTLRNVTVHCLQSASSLEGIDTPTVLEEVIDFLLQSLADGDTPVRYAASKALSVITLKLDPEMGGEVVEAILGSLNEDVYWEGSRRSLSGVNPLRWHGLTLTLAHLLYRKAPSTDQLPDILNALLLALAFEQRSATGGSIGTNVRDAACFGIWALSRRYLTKDLLAVQTTSIRASHQNLHSYSVPQVLAIELLVAACLDPAGNIRRGSSAALQELIGRHPDTVQEGIPLVQIVDFHAVGLRDRAICEVGINAAQLYPIYWDAIFENLLEWRGVGSLDTSSRLSAANAIGLLSRYQLFPKVNAMVKNIWQQLDGLASRQIEERHGLVMSLAFLISQSNTQSAAQRAPISDSEANPPPSRSLAELAELTRVWTIFDKTLNLEDKAFISPAMRPELTASAICSLLGALASISVQIIGSNETIQPPSKELVRLLDLCLGRTEESVLQAIPKTVIYTIEALQANASSTVSTVVSAWIDYLEQEASYASRRASGFAIALGAAYSHLSSLPEPDLNSYEQRIIAVLTFRCTAAVDIPARTAALQSLGTLLQEAAARATRSSTTTTNPSSLLPPTSKAKITQALNTALNDYTVTERGDVGALVRLEAIATTEIAWRTALLSGSAGANELHAAVLRLSVERLDKMRVRAAHCLEAGNQEHFEAAISGAADGVSSYAYFAEALGVFSPQSPAWLKKAVMEGYVSAAGMGSESVVQNARMVLVDAMERLPGEGEGEGGSCSLLDVMDILVELLKGSLANDRVLIPAMEVVAFLFDAGVVQRLVGTRFNFRALLSLTQKAHYKSTNINKLHIALDVYRGLAEIDSTRKDVLLKVASMLLHPFPKIRSSAAETLWVVTSDDDLKLHDWAQQPKNLKPAVEALKKRLGAT